GAARQGTRDPLPHRRGRRDDSDDLSGAPGGQMKRIPVLIPFLCLVACIFIGILVYTYVEAKKANPEMIKTSARMPARTPAWQAWGFPPLGARPALSAASTGGPRSPAAPEVKPSRRFCGRGGCFPPARPPPPRRSTNRA